MALDIAMGGSTNTILHLLAAAHEAGVSFGLKDIDELSRRVPCLCKVAPSSDYHVEDVHRAGGIPAILGELDRAGLLTGGVRTTRPYSQSNRWDTLDGDVEAGCVRDAAHAYSADGGLAVLQGNLAPHGAMGTPAGVPEELLTFTGPAKVFESQEDAVEGILGTAVRAGAVVIIRAA